MDIFYIYKITLLRGQHAGKYYIGQRKWRVPVKYQNLNICGALSINSSLDSYAGSGKFLKDYFKTHTKTPGVTYSKEIIMFCESADELNLKECEFIGTKYLTDPNCLNMMQGGDVHPSRAGHKRTDAEKRKVSEALKKYWAQQDKREHASRRMAGCNNPSYGKPAWNRGKKMGPAWNRGKKMSDEQRLKLSECKKNTMWVNNGVQSKLIKIDTWPIYLKSGWMRGKIGLTSYLYKDGKKIRVPKAEVQKYLDNGWDFRMLNTK